MPCYNIKTFAGWNRQELNLLLIGLYRRHYRFATVPDARLSVLSQITRPYACSTPIWKVSCALFHFNAVGVAFTSCGAFQCSNRLPEYRVSFRIHLRYFNVHGVQTMRRAWDAADSLDCSGALRRLAAPQIRSFLRLLSVFVLPVGNHLLRFCRIFHTSIHLSHKKMISSIIFSDKSAHVSLFFRIFSPLFSQISDAVISGRILSNLDFAVCGHL